MTTNPYQPPQAPVDAETTQAVVPLAIRKKIKNGWVAGLVSSGITCVLILLAISGVNLPGLNLWSFIDVAIMLGLSFGVFKNSRICAILLLGFFLLNKFLMISQSGTVSGLPLTIVFLWFFAQGVIGTFQYHKLKPDN